MTTKIALLAPVSSIHTHRWANALAEFYEVHVISLHTPKEAFLKDLKYTFHPLKVKAPYGYILNKFQVEKIISRIQPDLLHVHFASGYGTLGMLVDFEPKIVSVWGTDVYEFPFKSKIHHALINRILSKSTHVTATSEAMADHVCATFPGLKRPSVIAFGIDIDRFQPGGVVNESKCMEISPPDFNIGLVKALTPKYGIDILIKAFAMVTERLPAEQSAKLKLKIAGEGPQKKQLISLVERLGLQDKVEFSGLIPHAQVPEYMSGLDLFVVPSREESFGVAAIEASACGLPVIVSRVGGLPEVVLENKTGLVVDKEDIDGFAAQMIKMFNDSKLRQKLGQAGVGHVRSTYDWQDCVSKMRGIYESLLTTVPVSESKVGS